MEPMRLTLAIMSLFPILISVGYFIYHGDNIMAVIFILMIPFYIYVYSLLKD